MLQPQLLYFLFMQSYLIKENNMKTTGIIRRVADKYKGRIKDNVYEALYKWEVEIDD